MNEKTIFIESSGNVFEDFGIKDLEARNLEFRSCLMTLLTKYIQCEGLTQKEAAERLGVSQPRISNFVHGRIDLFSAGMLIDMLERAGFNIYEKIATNADDFFIKYDACA